MVSTIYTSSLDVVVTSGAAKLTRQHWWNLLDFSVTYQTHCAQASATILSQDQVNLSLKGATWSFLKYHSKFGLYGVQSVITRSKLSFSYGCNGGTLMEQFIWHHTTTVPPRVTSGGAIFEDHFCWSRLADFEAYRKNNIVFRRDFPWASS